MTKETNNMLKDKNAKYIHGGATLAVFHHMEKQLFKYALKIIKHVMINLLE